MKKKITALLTALLLLAIPAASAISDHATATYATVSVRGRPMEVLTFQVDNNNYFMLRDLAKALNGTNKQFDIAWDQSQNVTILHGGQMYQPQAEEEVLYVPEGGQIVNARVEYITPQGEEKRMERYVCQYGGFNL